MNLSSSRIVIVIRSVAAIEASSAGVPAAGHRLQLSRYTICQSHSQMSASWLFRNVRFYGWFG
ncbi:hypothetical protein, partial [Burkholderia ubonensis]|uniref:hypothetical protein n=1 Tax=Burkholderia ubonensis TaxID=101571 RepID=UPI001C43037D